MGRRLRSHRLQHAGVQYLKLNVGVFVTQRRLLPGILGVPRNLLTLALGDLSPLLGKYQSLLSFAARFGPREVTFQVAFPVPAGFEESL